MNDPTQPAPAEGPRGSYPYEVNIGKFIADHPGWRIQAGLEGVGYTAQRRDNGGVHGPRVGALTLDELAARLAALDETAGE